jgi:hypothetical protein
MENSYQKTWKENQLVELYDKFRRFIDPAEKEYIKILISEIEKHCRAHKMDSIRILDIGAGAGHSTVPILASLSKKFKIEYDYLDVSSNQKQEFIKEVKDNKLQKILGDFWITSWEKFSGGKKYDLILSYHSWYGITDWQSPRNNTLLKIKKYLTKNGMGAIVINSRNNITQDIVLERGEKIVSSENLLEAMKSLDIFFLKKPLYYFNFNKSTFLTGEKIKRSAYGFFGYLYRKPFGEMGKLEKEKLMRNLLNRKDDCYFKIPCDLIEIFK